MLKIFRVAISQESSSNINQLLRFYSPTDVWNGQRRIEENSSSRRLRYLTSVLVID